LKNKKGKIGEYFKNCKLNQNIEKLCLETTLIINDEEEIFE